MYLRARPAPGWLAYRMLTRYLADGYFEEDAGSSGTPPGAWSLSPGSWPWCCANADFHAGCSAQP